MKKNVITACLIVFAASCGGDLNSLDGPETGIVSGLVCHGLPQLAAAATPGVSGTLIREGQCMKIPSSTRVDIVRTVMMPGDGKYSQFELKTRKGIKKMWIKTSRIRVTS